MMRSSSSTSLQKTYDECFLTCSTAVYFEGQNNEAEALRSWKSALDQIYGYNASRGPAHYRPRSETERALHESLRQLELQCKERVDLLEALKKSRNETEKTRTASSSSPPPRRPQDRPSEAANAWLGGGTVPPVRYSDLSRPPLPHRLSAPQEGSAESLSPKPPFPAKEQRTPSPGKKTRMLRTLRPGGKEGSRSSSSSLHSRPNSRPPVAAKAANLAFGANAYTNPGRPVYQAGSTSSESLVASHGAASRSSLDRPGISVDARNTLASSAAARSWSDLTTDKAPGLSRQPKLPQYMPLANNSRARHPKPSAPLGDISPEAEAETDQNHQPPRLQARPKQDPARVDVPTTPCSPTGDPGESDVESDEWRERVRTAMKNLPRGVDESAALQILNDIVIQGDEVHWDDIAGLDVAKSALKETVVYPFLRPDLFMGLREPAKGMLLFGPPGTGKTMLARAVATESMSTFFAISASSLTSKFLGESEKLVRALFALARMLAPSIIFVDEIDSLLSSRSSSGEHEATRRIKTEFLIQWSDLAKAAAGRETSEKDREKGDASRVLVLAATNLPWAIDEAARRRFVRRQYIPLPEGHVRKAQLKTLLSHQKHELDEQDMDRLVALTEGFSGSDITSLAKDAAMGPLRNLGEKLLHMTMDEIRPMRFEDFQASLATIRPSVGKHGLQQYEDWAREFGERGG